MAQLIFGKCKYAEITNRQITVCNRITRGTLACDLHSQWADEINWLENHVGNPEMVSPAPFD